MFDTKFISDYRILNTINECTLLIQSPDGKTNRILNTINECTLLIQSPDGKTRKFNTNNAKSVSAITAADNMLQDFKQSILRREHTHPYNLCNSSM